MAVFINEITYDTVGGDVGEAIEVVVTDSTDITGWTIVLYNGNGGATYDTDPLTSGTLTTVNGVRYYVISYPQNGIQNGAPDAIALVNGAGVVFQFLSYEGVVTATNGPAMGTTSVNIGVSQTEAPVGTSLQLTGTGDEYSEFTWTANPVANTFGAANTGQTIQAGGGGAGAGALSIANASVAEGNAGTTALTFTVARNNGSTGAVSAAFSVNLNGTANAADFVGGAPAGGTVSFADGVTSQTITVNVQGDLDIEASETFAVTLSAPAGGATLGTATATGTITNDDAAPVVPGQVFINEIHYDDVSTDDNEGVEIAGPAGTDLTGWRLIAYNGNGGADYLTVTLSGTIPAQDDGFGTRFFAMPGLQNGGEQADGIALIDASGAVVPLLSYEGVLTATSGPASGLTAPISASAKTLSPTASRSSLPAPAKPMPISPGRPPRPPAPITRSTPGRTSSPMASSASCASATRA